MVVSVLLILRGDHIRVNPTNNLDQFGGESGYGGMGDWIQKCRGFMPRCFTFFAAPSSFGLRSIRRPSRLDLERIWQERAIYDAASNGKRRRAPTRLDLERIWREQEAKELARKAKEAAKYIRDAA